MKDQLKSRIILNKKWIPVLFILIISCTTKVDSTVTYLDSENEEKTETSKLDTILGDKILDDLTDSIRLNNFESFKNLNEADLLVKSKLYDIDLIENGFYLINQKKVYTAARLFSAILKVNDGKVVNYFVLNDFTIKDVKIVDSNLHAIADDYDNKNTFWRYKGLVKMLNLNLDFSQNWVYTITSESALEGMEINYINNSTIWKINVMPGSSMLHNYFELKLNDLGEFKSVKWRESFENYNALSELEMNKIFKNNLTSM